jgi:hypothetical protein
MGSTRAIHDRAVVRVAPGRVARAAGVPGGRTVAMAWFGGAADRCGPAPVRVPGAGMWRRVRSGGIRLAPVGGATATTGPNVTRRSVP